jgi:MoaE-MoaD fusion protein
MEITVLYFALVREHVGLESETVTLPDGAKVSDLRAILADRHAIVARAQRHLRVAVNEDFALDSDVLKEGDEVALIPPVAGGAPLCSLTKETIDPRQVEALVERPEAGAVVTFTGVVRNHAKGRAVDYLVYEVYESMALGKLREVAAEVSAAHPEVLVAVSHRHGKLVVGDIAIVIAVSSPHRAVAFAACQQTIDRIKEVVPIWKKEVGPDGKEWVGFGS